MCTINIQGVNITLTKDQLDQIDNQRNKFITHFTQIDSYESACKVLNKTIDLEADIVTKIRTIGKAINSLIIINDKFPNWNNNNQKKHYPVFENKAGVGLVFCFSYCACNYSYGQVVYLKSEEASNYISKTFINLYKELIEEEM